MVKWLCAPRGPEAELVFSLSWFSRWWRGGRARLREVKFSFACQKRTRKPPAISTRWIHEKGAARPFQTPKGLSKPKNASRFAKRIFLCFSHLRLRRRFYLSAELHALRGRNTCCEAANRRNEKKALSAATSFFPFRQLLRDYQGRAALDSCLPRLESSGCFSGSLLARKRELDLTATAIYPALPARDAAQKKKSQCSTWNTGPLPHLCAAAVGMRTVYSMYPSRSSRCAVAGTPLSVIRRMAWSMVFTKMRTSFTIEMR